MDPDEVRFQNLRWWEEEEEEEEEEDSRLPFRRECPCGGRLRAVLRLLGVPLRGQFQAS